MTSHTIPFSPRRRRFDSNGSGPTTPRNHFAMTPPDCMAESPPPSIKGRKLFDEDQGSRTKNSTHPISVRRRSKLKSSLAVLISISILHMFWWRVPLLSYLTESKVSKEQEIDAWILLQKDVEMLRRREAKREARRRGNTKLQMQRNRRGFVPIPKLKRKPFEMQPLPGLDKALQSTFSRVVQLDAKAKPVRGKQEKPQPWVSHNSTNEESEDEPDLTRSQTVVYDSDRECVPMSDWQATFHPTCNSVHDIDAASLLDQFAFHLVSSKGFWRNAWRVNVTTDADLTHQQRMDRNATNEFIVLKSLKYVHEPNDETFELSRVDAVSLEQLTGSKFTINIYGFCGTSSLQEFASGDLKGLLPVLEPEEKLKMAMWIAEGVADVHAVDYKKSARTNKNSTRVPTLIHNDINMDNVLLGKRNGVEVPLLNDYNIAVFRKKDAKTGEPCPFRGRFANPQWMSSEQQERPEDELSTGYLNEKIDVYALGNILYKVAVGNSPWKADYKTTKITPELKGKIARAKLRGAKPKVPFEIRNTTDASILAVLNAMDWCYRNDPNLRPSAAAIASGLRTALLEAEQGMTNATMAGSE